MRGKIIRLLSASSLLLVAGITVAGSPAYPNVTDLSGFYAGVDLGGVYNTQLDAPSSTFANAGQKGTPWGWTWSAFIGYQFNSNWSLQFGYIMYENQKLKKSASSSSTNIKFDWYNIYVAAKINVPIFDMFSAYALVGPVYTNADTYADAVVGNLGISRGRKSIWTPMGAIGLTYHWTDYLRLSVQYMFIMKDIRSQTTANASPSLMNIDSNTQRLTFAASYLFTM